LKARVTALLDDAGLGQLGTRQLGTLSGGELRRVLIADALERKPDLLLLDEPEASLDDTARTWLEAMLRTLPARGLTTLLITHDPALARLATRSLTLGSARA
jgi:ABC-type Mn2+/Zn2+ transport system ATPase subunit